MLLLAAAYLLSPSVSASDSMPVSALSIACGSLVRRVSRKLTPQPVA